MSGLVQIIRPDGLKSTTHSTYCPKCGEPSPTKTVDNEADFDESGWFYRAHMQCRNVTRCKHEWVEKIVTISGGFSF